jgi:ACS family tartrate transporter-like MFS transporter
VLGLCALCLLGSNYALNFFLPLILRRLTGLSVGNVGYLIAIAAGAGAVAMIAYGMHSDRTRERHFHVIIPALLLAMSLLIAGLHLRGWIAAVVLLVAWVMFFAMQAPWVAILTELFRGEENALAIAATNMMGIVGGFLGPYWTGWMRDLTGGYAVGVGSLCVPWLVFAAGLAWVMKPRTENVTSRNEKVMNAAPELAD